jgi:hypothetical protein
LECVTEKHNLSFYQRIFIYFFSFFFFFLHFVFIGVECFFVSLGRVSLRIFPFSIPISSETVWPCQNFLGCFLVIRGFLDWSARASLFLFCFVFSRKAFFHHADRIVKYFISLFRVPSSLWEGRT